MEELKNLRLECIYRNFRKKYFCEISKLLFDSEIENELKGQYHYGSYILTSVLIYNKEPAVDIINDIEFIFDFLEENILNSEVMSSFDFNLESICLAHWYCHDDGLKNLLRVRLIGFSDFLDSDVSASAVDYYLLRYFNIRYFNKFFSFNFNVEKKIQEVIGRVLGSDGVLFDSFSKEKGVPDLVYHCRNLQILQSYISILGEVDFLSVVKNGFQYLSYLTNGDLDIGVYGRSTESVYGYASLLQAISYYQSDNENINYDSVLNTIVKKFILLESNDIEIAIGGSESNKHRCGYDSYMYPVVYKYFALSRMLMAESNRLSSVSAPLKLNKSISPLYLDKASGFLRIMLQNKYMLLNLYGHQDSLIRPNDLRYLPGVPYVYQVIDKWKSPYVPFKSICKFSGETLKEKLRRKIYEFLSKIKYSTPHVGLHPVFIHGGCSVIASENSLEGNLNNEVYLKTKKFKLWPLGLKKLLPRVFYEIGFSRDFSISHKILVSNENIYFSYRSNKMCKIEYGVRVGVGDKYRYDGNFFYINDEKILEFSLDIEKIICKKKFECSGGWVCILKLSFEKITDEFLVVY